MATLKSHGHHQMWLEDNIIYIVSEGPWNIEYFMFMHKELFELVQPIKSSPYAIHLTLLGNAIPVPEGIELHEAFVRQGSAKAIAIVMSACETKQISQAIFSKSYNKCLLKNKFFERSEDATTWLKGFLTG